MDSMSERTPLLGARSLLGRDEEANIHEDFCLLVGLDPASSAGRHKATSASTLYGRVTKKRNTQNMTYVMTSSLSNTLLLSQVVLGAALTALGASASSHILITIFGALNTVIAGLVAYLKSRGQPMRARMFRDDLDRVIDEIENSEVMWLGIANNIHGYNEIAIDDTVSIRSEVARLTRLYDKAVRSNTANDPDMYQAATQGFQEAALRARPEAAQPALPAIPPPATAPGASAEAPAPAQTPAPPPAALPAGSSALSADPDLQGPATTQPKSKEGSVKGSVKDKGEDDRDKGKASEGAAGEKGPGEEPASDEGKKSGPKDEDDAGEKGSVKEEKTSPAAAGSGSDAGEGASGSRSSTRSQSPAAENKAPVVQRSADESPATRR